MNQKRFSIEFKIEAVRQIVERGHPVAKATTACSSG
jgi:transposase-like protein